MLVEMAIGDAYGAAFEFITPERQREEGLANDGTTYRRHPELPIGDGRYTDDTQMAIAVAEVLLETPAPTRERFADKFVEVFKRDERPGYGKRFYALLKQVDSGEELLARLDPSSTRSGAAMRAGPVGLLPSIEDVLRVAALQASVTHDSPEGRMSAQAVAAAVHFMAYRRGPKRDLGAYLEHHVPGHAWSAEWSGWVSVRGMECAHAALSAVRLGEGMADILRRSVATGGDVDTVAAIALCVAGAGDVRRDLAPSLHEGLERGRFGADYLADLDGRLRAWATSNGASLGSGYSFA